MRGILTVSVVALCATGLNSLEARAQAPGGPAVAQAAPGVAGIVLTNNRTLDVSSPDAIVKGLIKDEMNPQQKAYTLWKYFTQRGTHREDAPYEDTANTAELMNKYGYCLCGTWGWNFANLATIAGLEASPLGIKGHVVAQVKYGGGWHVYDADMWDIYADKDGVVLPLGEITKLTDAAGKSVLPPIVSCPFYEGSAPVTQLFVGNAPNQAMTRADGKWKYQLDLRPGAEVSWYWHGDPEVGSASVTHIIQVTDGYTRQDERNLKHHKTISEYLADTWDYYQNESENPKPVKEKYTWGYRRGGINAASQMYWNGSSSNGRLTMDLGHDRFANALAMMDEPQNVEVKDGKLTLKDAAKNGSFVLDFRMPYVYADGWVEKPLPEKGLKIEITTDGKAFKEVYPTGGLDDGKRIRLVEFIRAQPRFKLKVTIAAGSAALANFRAVGVFHHAWNALPALLKGENKVAIRAQDAKALSANPLHVTHVYDQVSDDHEILRNEKVLTFTPDKLAQAVDTGARHWPLMREIRIRCGGPAPEAAKPVKEEGDLDWGAYPYDRNFWGVSVWNDFERGDRGQWVGRLTPKNTYNGSDFSLDNSLMASDGNRQLKFIRFGSYLNRDSKFRCMFYVKNAGSLTFRTCDIAKNNVYFQKVFRNLKDGQWQPLEVSLSELEDPKDSNSHPANLDFMRNLYLSVWPLDMQGKTAKDVEFLIDDCVLYDGTLKFDPTKDPDAAKKALADDPFWNAKIRK